ncbi:hypothetical protein HAX54_015884, partial [Datura stramonium]|nr:hypothetical protein [Datura stramonium]
MAYTTRRQRQCMEQCNMPGLWHYDQHSSGQWPESPIPVRLGTEVAKLNSNPSKNDEGLIYYYIYPCV